MNGRVPLGARPLGARLPPGVPVVAPPPEYLGSVLDGTYQD